MRLRFPPGAGRWAPPSGSGWRSGFPCVPHLTATGDVRVPTWRSAFPGRCATFPGGVCAETWTTRLVWVIAAAALRAAVPAPTGRTGQRSAFPCLRATLSRWGMCRDRRHTGTGRHAVSRPCGPQCRSEDQRSRSSRPAYKERTPGPAGPGVPVGFSESDADVQSYLAVHFAKRPILSSWSWRSAMGSLLRSALPVSPLASHVQLIVTARVVVQP